MILLTLKQSNPMQGDASDDRARKTSAPIGYVEEILREKGKLR